MTRTIPGRIIEADREFLYVEALEGESFSQILGNAIAPSPDVPSPRAGGAIEEKVRVVLPNRKSLIAISYRGDLAGWRRNLQAYCHGKGRIWGVFTDDGFVLSDGTSFSLSDCEVIFEL
jgi:hypothetical protein